MDSSCRSAATTWGVLATEIGAGQHIFADLGGRTRHLNHTVGEYDGPVGHAEHRAGELFDHQYRHPAGGDVSHLLVQLGDDLGGQTHRQLVDEKDRRIDGERPSERQHLLFATRHGAGQLRPTFAEARKTGVGVVFDGVE